MKRINLFLLLTLFIVGKSFAQVSEEDGGKLRKNELMIESASANHFNFMMSSVNPSILYRRNFKTTSLRVRTSLVNNNEFSASVGIQKNIPIASNIHFYWGADLFGRKVDAIENNEYFHERIKILQSGVSPVIGLKVNLSKRIFIGVENSSALYMEDYDRHIDYRDPADEDVVLKQPSFQFDLYRNTRFNLGFKFY